MNPAKCPMTKIDYTKCGPLHKWQRLIIENVTIARPPMLKIYFWESFNIVGLNKLLEVKRKPPLFMEHNIVVPTQQINSHPLKAVFWLRNDSDSVLELCLKRIKNCDCRPMETRVGFNQFRHLYHCPHRRLINISQEFMRIQPHELVAMSVMAYFYLFGEHKLSFEITFADKRVLHLHFLVDVTTFDPEKCLLNHELIPVNIREFQRYVQPIWVRNITTLHLCFSFCANDKSFKLLNSSLTVPSQSVWPLLVEYRPTDFENNLELFLSYDNSRYKHMIRSVGVLEEEDEKCDMPLRDYECADFLYVIYPNRLEFVNCLGEDRTQLVNVHNYNQNCMEFRWQNYIINDFFAITFEPTTFRLKPHHSKLCIVKVAIQERPVQFRRIPVVLEVHRILDRSTQIAQELLEEIESIDDPKWKESSYVEHVFLHLNLKSYIEKTPEPEDTQEITNIADISLNKALTTNEIIAISMKMDQRITIFEKLFWKYLSKSNFMRLPTTRITSEPNQTYTEIIEKTEFEQRQSPMIDRKTILGILSQLMYEAVNDLSKNWIFIPSQYYDRLA